MSQGRGWNGHPEGVCVLLGRILFVSQPPTAAAQLLLKWERKAQGGQVWLPVLHDDISALTGSVWGRIQSFGFSSHLSLLLLWAIRSLPGIQEPSGLEAPPSLVEDLLLLLKPHPYPSIFFKYVREPSKVFWLILKLIEYLDHVLKLVRNPLLPKLSESSLREGS